MDRGQSLLIPPLFDGTNYAYWKVRMKVFLQALGEQVWQAVEVGWIKSKEAPVDWDKATIIAANFNSKALNALFFGVTNEEFKKISSVKVAKEARTILETTYEGTKAVKTVMDHGQSLLIPPLFNGINYAYWKVRMKVFLQALGEQVWQDVEVSWIKPKEVPMDWDDVTIIAVNFNSRALNALFCGVTNEEFKKISSTEVAKEAWAILETTYEGTKAVKIVKLQRLTSSFEEIRMEEDGTFDEFYAKLKDIVNFAFNLGESIAESKIVRKILRSLPERFHAKITVI